MKDVIHIIILMDQKNFIALKLAQIKVIEEKNRCIDDCKNDDVYKYEYNNICFEKCPNGTYTLEDKEDNLCYDIIPDGYYLDLKDEKYKKCYKSCNKCIIGGNTFNNNCIESKI